MIAKARNVTIAEMVDQYDFIMEVLRIPETTMPSGMVCIADIGSGRALRKYEQESAELIADHMAEKCKVRNRRRADRKHKLTPKMRKEQEELRNWNICGKYMNCGWTLINDAKYAEKEQFARADYEVEQRNHADSMAEYRDYCHMAEDHAERLEYLRNLTGNVDFWERMIDYVSREKIYEENRIREMQDIANGILKGECY